MNRFHSNSSLTNAVDCQLARVAQTGDLDAFEELVRRYQRPLLCFLRYYCHSSHDVEDVAQDAFLKCYVHLDQFDPTRNFKTWLYTIARRSISRPRVANTVSLAMNPEIASSQSGPSTEFIQQEFNESLWQTIRRVTSDDEFQLIWFRYAERLPVPEIARIFEQSIPACKMRLSRLRSRLKPHLQHFLHDNSPSGSGTESETRAA